MATSVVDTPIGPLGLVASEAGLSRVLFRSGNLRAQGESAVLEDAAAQLAEYFAGDRTTFDLPSTSRAPTSSAGAGWRSRTSRTAGP
jgi:methylated-DNA-[protein]-cysteine S-methyltransferase